MEFSGQDILANFSHYILSYNPLFGQRGWPSHILVFSFFSKNKNKIIEGIFVIWGHWQFFVSLGRHCPNWKFEGGRHCQLGGCLSGVCGLFLILFYTCYICNFFLVFYSATLPVCRQHYNLYFLKVTFLFYWTYDEKG